MTTTTKQRTVRLTTTDGGLVLVIRQQEGKAAVQVDAYFLTLTAAGYLLSKHDGTKYEVAGGRCTCKGNTHHGHCKHVESLLALEQAGKLYATRTGNQGARRPVRRTR